jgi:hypothetical protein
LQQFILYQLISICLNKEWNKLYKKLYYNLIIFCNLGE